jgi:hypothetical protein
MGILDRLWRSLVPASREARRADDLVCENGTRIARVSVGSRWADANSARQDPVELLLEEALDLGYRHVVLDFSESTLSAGDIHKYLMDLHKRLELIGGLLFLFDPKKSYVDSIEHSSIAVGYGVQIRVIANLEEAKSIVQTHGQAK